MDGGVDRDPQSVGHPRAPAPTTQRTSPSCELRARDLLPGHLSRLKSKEKVRSFTLPETFPQPGAAAAKRATAQPSDCGAETRARVPSGARVPGMVTRGELRVGRAALLGVVLMLTSSLRSGRPGSRERLEAGGLSRRQASAKDSAGARVGRSAPPGKHRAPRVSLSETVTGSALHHPF